MWALSVTTAGAEAASDLETADVSFTSSDGTTLHGTIIAPAGERGQLPGLVLVHGSGPATRDWHRQEAEAFARAGVVTLTYDKRTAGYSLFERSYSQLADDALAAHGAVQAHEDVDPERVGLWGLSEGGWVAPLAAANAEEVDFLVTVGANGIPPAQQESWAKANRLHRAGVSGSMVRAYASTAVRLLADAGMFPEAHHDPVPVLEDVEQPVLAIWGEQERVSPPAENLSIFNAALERGGNESHTLRVLADGDHAAYRSPDGGFATNAWITTEGQFAPRYVELVTSWIHGLADGAPASSVDTPPEQQITSTPLPPSGWYESSAAQLAALVLFVGAFAGHLLITGMRRLRGHRQRSPAARPARWLAITGLSTVIGCAGYFGGMLLSTEAVIGPAIVGRAVPWLVLQVLAVGVVLAALTTALAWWRTPDDIGIMERGRLGLLLTAAAVFVPWALYWGLLLP